MHTTCIRLHVLQRSPGLADPAIYIRLIVETPPVSVKIEVQVLVVVRGLPIDGDPGGSNLPRGSGSVVN